MLYWQSDYQCQVLLYLISDPGKPDDNADYWNWMKMENCENLFSGCDKVGEWISRSSNFFLL